MEEVPVVIFGDGSQSRDFTYSLDIAMGTIKAINIERFEIINLVNGSNPISLNIMIELIEKYTGKKASIKKSAFLKEDFKISRADNTKAKSLLGWKPETDFEEGIKRTIHWFEENEDFIKSIHI